MFQPDEIGRVESEPARLVLVATELIRAGTPARAWSAVMLAPDQVKCGAISDPETLKGQKAREDVFPGEQLIAVDFGLPQPRCN